MCCCVCVGGVCVYGCLFVVYLVACVVVWIGFG